MDLFSTREIASAVWIAVFLIWAASMRPVRAAFGNLLRAFFVRRIMQAFALMTIYVAGQVYILSTLSLWDIGQLKSTLIWSIAIAAASMFNLPTSMEETGFFRTTAINCAKLTLFVEFLISKYTLIWWGEMLLVPVLTILAALLAYSESQKEHAKVSTLLTNVLAIIMAFLIGYAIYRMALDFTEFATLKTLTEFTLPPILTLMFLPFVYLLFLYSKYELTFTSLKFSIKDPAVRSYAEFVSVMAFGNNMKLLNRWKRDVGVSHPSSKGEVKATIREVLRNHRTEQNPALVKAEDGWSPYLAKDFLADHGLSTNDYHRFPTEPNEWFAGSSYLEIGDDVFPDNLSYYVDGAENAATQLKLILNVNNPKSGKQSEAALARAAQILSQKAFNATMPQAVVTAIGRRKPLTAQFSGSEIFIEKVEFTGGIKGGYSIDFTIRKITHNGTRN